MNKRTKISLGAASALVAVATPVVTAVSCGKEAKTSKKESRHVKGIAATPGVESVNAKIDLDKIFKKAKKNSTDLNIKNKLVKTAGPLKYFDAQSDKYVDPLYYTVGSVIEELMTSMSKDAPKIKPILNKLKKDNGLYNISKDIIQGILDKKILKLYNPSSDSKSAELKKASINEIITAPSGQGGLLGFGLATTAILQSPLALINDVIQSVWKNTKDDLEKTGITVGEVASLLRQIDKSKITISLKSNGKEIKLLDKKQVKIPDMLWIVFGEGNNNSLAKTLDVLMPNLDAVLPKLFGKLPEEPVGNLIRKLLSMEPLDTSKLSKADKKKLKPQEDAKSIYQTSNKNQPGLSGGIGGLMELFKDATIGKINAAIVRIARHDVSPIDPRLKLEAKDVEKLMKLLPIPTKYKSMLGLTLSIMGRVADLYQA